MPSLKSASVVEGGVLRKLLCSSEIRIVADCLFLFQKWKNMDLNEKMYYNTLTKLKCALSWWVNINAENSLLKDSLPYLHGKYRSSQNAPPLPTTTFIVYRWQYKPCSQCAWFILVQVFERQDVCWQDSQLGCNPANQHDSRGSGAEECLPTRTTAKWAKV